MAGIAGREKMTAKCQNRPENGFCGINDCPCKNVNSDGSVDDSLTSAELCRKMQIAAFGKVIG